MREQNVSLLLCIENYNNQIVQAITILYNLAHIGPLPLNVGIALVGAVEQGIPGGRKVRVLKQVVPLLA